MNVILRAAILCLALFIEAWLSVPCRAQFLGPPVINPARYSSPSGEYVLTVDPEDKYGEGAAAYRLTRHGHQLWARRRPFTLHSAIVTDSGLVGGYGYRGEVREAETPLEIVIFNRTGRLRLHERIRRQQPPRLHASPEPIGEGIFSDSNQNRLIVRLHVWNDAKSKMEEIWRQYRLSTGARLPDFSPEHILKKAHPDAWIAEAVPIAGTPLTVLQWNGMEDVIFTLIDDSRSVLWTRMFRHDYAYDLNDAKRRALCDQARGRAILPWSHAGQFALWSVAQNARIIYSVVQAHGRRWKVSEVSRSRYPVPAPAMALIPDIALQSLDHFDLVVPGQGSAPEIRKIAAFTFAGPGRIAFLRDVVSRHPALVVTQFDGHIESVTPLPAPPLDGSASWSSIAWLGKSRYIIGRNNKSTGPVAVFVDAGPSAVTPVTMQYITYINALAAFPDGRFVALGTEVSPYTLTTIIASYSPAGKRLWSRTLDGNDQPDGTRTPSSLDSVAITTDGRVAGIEPGENTLWFFDAATGKLQRHIDLKSVWKVEPRYTSDVWPDAHGGLIIRNFQGKMPIVRVDSNGKILDAFSPCDRMGKPVDTNICGVQQSPDGKLWTSDGNTLLQLDEHGISNTVLGELPNANALREIATLTIDQAGHIFALDGRTNTVHVFDAHGVWLHACPLGAPKVTPFPSMPILSVSAAGDLLVDGVDGGGSGNSPKVRLHFSADGKRLADIVLTGANTENTLERPSVSLVRHDGGVLRTMSHRADGTWFGMSFRPITGADGSFCVFDEDWPSVQTYVSLYSPSGAPLRTFPMPEAVGSAYNFAYNGELIVVAKVGSLYGISKSGRPLWRFTPKAGGSNLEPYFTDHGRTLTVWTEGVHFERYAMP